MFIATQYCIRSVIRAICLAIIIQVTTATLNPAGGPHNQVTAVGGFVTFTCQQTTTNAEILWKFYPVSSATPCIIYPTISPICPDVSRYVLTNTSGVYMLTIHNVKFSDAGTYECLDRDVIGINSGSLTSLFGVIDTSLNVTSNPCALQGQNLSYTCEVYYNGSDVMPPSMNWTTPSRQVIVGTVSNSSGWYYSSLTVNATSTSLQSSCTVFFKQPSGNVYQATNAPNYTNTASSSSATVKYCPSSLSITHGNSEPVAGSVPEGTKLTCTAKDGNGNGNVTYQWRNSTTGDVIVNGPTVTVAGESDSDFNYTCFAWSTIECAWDNTRWCNLSTTVYGTITATTTAAITTAQSTTQTSITSETSGSSPASAITPTSGSIPTPGPDPLALGLGLGLGLGIPVAVLIVFIIALCRPCSCCCECWKSMSDKCCAKCKPHKEKNYQQNASDDSSDLTPEQCHSNPMFNTSNNYPMSSPRNPPDLIHHHPGDSRPYPQNNQGSDPVYADLTENKPGSRKPVAMPSDTVYAPIDKA